MVPLDEEGLDLNRESRQSVLSLSMSVTIGIVAIGILD